MNENFWKFAALAAVGIGLVVALTNRPEQDTDDTSGDVDPLPPVPDFGVDYTPPPWLNPWRNPLAPVRPYNPEDPFGVDLRPNLPVLYPDRVIF